MRLNILLQLWQFKMKITLQCKRMGDMTCMHTTYIVEQYKPYPKKHANSLTFITLTKGARACYVGKVCVVTQTYGYQSIKFMQNQ